MRLFKKKEQTRQEIIAARRQASAHDEQISASQNPGMFDDSAELFRRNRTLAGRSHDDIAQSDRTKVHALRKKQRSLTGILMGMGVSAALLLVLITQLVAKVDVSFYGSLERGIEANKSKEYEKIFNEYFLTHPLERLRVFLNEQSLIAYLQAHGHAEVQSIVSIAPAQLGTVKVQFKIREPIASWVVDNERKYVDSTGVIFDKNYFPNPPRIQIVDESGLQVAGNKAVTSARFLGFVGMGVGYFTEHKIAIKKVVIPSGVTRQVQFVTTDDTIIKLATDRPVGEQTEDAVRSLAFFAKESTKPQYVDVRISGKAYYK